MQPLTQSVEERLRAVVTPEYLRRSRYKFWYITLLSAGGQLRLWWPLNAEDYAWIAVTYLPALAAVETKLRRISPAASGHYTNLQLRRVEAAAKPCPGCGSSVLSVETACPACGSASPHGRVSPIVFWGVIGTVILALVALAYRSLSYT